MISIIIPLYNRADLISETLDSIVAQTHTDWECLVVDDDSIDNSVKVVQKYAEQDSRIRLLIRPEDRIKGACSCRNFGYENSIGEIVYFFDSDDLLSPGFLAAVTEGMERNPAADYAAFTLERFVTNPKNPYYTSRKYQPQNGGLFEQIISCRTQTNTQNTLWRRCLLERTGILWNTQLPRCQDGDFICRMIGLAEQGVWLDMPTMVHVRVHSGSIGGKFSKTIEEAKIQFHYRNELYDYYSKIGKMTPVLHRLLMKSLFRFQLISAVISSNRAVSLDYYHALCNRSRQTWMDRFITVQSRVVVAVVPLLAMVSGILARMGVARFRHLTIRRGIQKKYHERNGSDEVLHAN